MPVVPITAASEARNGQAPQQVEVPPPQFALMAAAQMHSEGRLIQKVGTEFDGDFNKGVDSGYEMLPPDTGTLKIQTRDRVNTLDYPGSSEDKSFSDDMTNFIKNKKLIPGDVAKDKDGKFWMYQPGGEYPFTRVRPKDKSPSDAVS